jgi:hypothetical protein
MIPSPLLCQISVWRKISDVKAIRYNCLKNLETDEFRVLIADFLNASLNENHFGYQYFIDQILAEDPIDPEQPRWYLSLKDAISAHDDDFADID